MECQSTIIGMSIDTAQRCFPIITSYKEVFGETCAHMLIDYQWNANLQCADMFGETCPHMLIDYQLNDN